MFYKSIAAFFMAAALTGCATPNYFHPGIEDRAEVERTKTIHLAECRQYASAGIPFPTYVPVPGEKPSKYSVQGTVSGIDSSGQYNLYHYSGTATSVNQGGFAKGFAAGSNVGADIARGMQVRELTNACMLSRGWTNTEAEASAIKVKMLQEADKKAEKAKNSLETDWEWERMAFLAMQHPLLNGGINYLEDEEKLSTLDAYAKFLATDPGSQGKKPSWFFAEADKLVRLKYGEK